MYCTRASSCVEKPDYLQKADVKHTAILESSDPLRTNGCHIMYLCSHSCKCTILVLFCAGLSGSPHNVLHSTSKQISQKTFQSIPFHKNQLPTCACHMSMFIVSIVWHGCQVVTPHLMRAFLDAVVFGPINTAPFPGLHCLLFVIKYRRCGRECTIFGATFTRICYF